MSTKVAVIDYGVGNLMNAAKAFASAGADAVIVSKPDEARSASALVLPGVGNFGDGMKNLAERGFDDFIREWTSKARPFIGICLGMQMLLDASEEAAGVKGLGIIKGCSRLFPAGKEKVPQIGWNTVRPSEGARLFKGMSDEPYFYFVHSYYVCPEDAGTVGSTTEYVLPYASSLECGNAFAVQFHPEKSQANGLKLIKNFLDTVKHGE